MVRARKFGLICLALGLLIAATSVSAPAAETEEDGESIYLDADKVVFEEISSEEYYGSAYQDVSHRVPSVREAKERLGWEPTTDLRTMLKLTLDYHLLHQDYELNALQTK